MITEPEYVKKYQSGASIAMYFHAELDRSPKSVEVFYQNGELLSKNEIKGTGAIMSLHYDTKEGDQITTKIGLSYTSIENARLNLKKEAKNLDFDEVTKATTKKWNEYLVVCRFREVPMQTK